MKLPEMVKIRQKFDDTHINNIEATIKAELGRLDLKLEKGARIAITAGSRGIDNIAGIVRAVVEYVRSLGGDPFIVPAMGSHGGATAEGQLKVLRELGMEPHSADAPFLATMDTEVIGFLELETFEGDGSPVRMPVHMDRYAAEADGIIVVNRVKPHTSFHAEFESGLMKMMAVGLGKELQAAGIHSHGTRGLRELIAPMARVVLSTGKIIAGLGLVENAYDKLMEIKAFLPDGIETGEKELLEKARRSMPSLPVNRLDVLVVEEMGKNISGTGMDTNIIGRLRIEGEPEPQSPSIGRIAVLGLTGETGGNAYGVGLADFTTQKLVDRMDYKNTYANVLATGFVERAKIPVIAPDDEEAVAMALKTCGISDVGKARIARIRNTLQLEYVWVSRNVYEEISDKVEIIE